MEKIENYECLEKISADQKCEKKPQKIHQITKILKKFKIMSVLKKFQLTKNAKKFQLTTNAKKNLHKKPSNNKKII